MIRDDALEPLLCEDRRLPISAGTQSVPPLNLCRHPISAERQSLPPRNLCYDPKSIPIDDLESMKDAVHCSDLGSVTISADDLMDNRMLYQRSYPVALEHNESMEDPFSSDQSHAAMTHITGYETHHSPHDPPMFEDRSVRYYKDSGGVGPSHRYQSNVNRAANVQVDHHPGEGYLLRIQRIFKNRSLMKTLLHGMAKGFMALLVANGLYGDIIYYHSGSNGDQTTIVADNATVAASNYRDNFPRRLSADDPVLSNEEFGARILKAIGLSANGELLQKLTGINLQNPVDKDHLLVDLKKVGILIELAEKIANTVFAELYLEYLKLSGQSGLLKKMVGIDLQDAANRGTLVQDLKMAQIPTKTARLINQTVQQALERGRLTSVTSPTQSEPGTPPDEVLSDAASQSANALSYAAQTLQHGQQEEPTVAQRAQPTKTFKERILEAIGLSGDEEKAKLRKQLEPIDLENAIDRETLEQKLKDAGIDEAEFQQKIVGYVFAERILDAVDLSGHEKLNYQLLRKLYPIDLENPIDRKSVLQALESAGVHWEADEINEIVNVVLAQRILKDIGFPESNELLRQLRDIDLQSVINRTDLLEELKSKGVPEASARGIVNARDAAKEQVAGGDDR